MFTITKRHKCSNGGQAIVVSSLEIVDPPPEIAVQPAKSIVPTVTKKRETFSNAPLCRVSLHAFWNDEIDMVFSFELAVLPVTNDPLGLLPNRWNCTIAYKCAVNTTG